MKKLLLSAIIFLSYTKSFSQTCIIVALRNDTITIGADGRLGTSAMAYYKNGEKRDTIMYSTICKIRSKDNVFYTGAGTGGDIIFKYGKESIINHNGKIEIKYPFQKVTKFLETDIEKIRLKSKKVFLRDYMGEHVNFLGALFLYFQNNTATIYALYFKIISQSDKQVRVKISDEYIYHKTTDRHLEIIGLGHTDAIGPYVYSVVGQYGLAKGVKRLLQFQADATPNEVGSPFSIVQFTPAKVNWIDTGACNLPTNK